MLDFVYTIVIFPIVQAIDLCYLFSFRLFHNQGLAVCGVSLAVSVCTLPLYFMAERHENAERELQKRLRPKIDRIKAAFKGDEQFMILSAYYRQNHYHPVYALRGTLGILIQIPFFIAAYSYLSHLPVLQGAPLLRIQDLSKPDALLKIGGEGSLNLLPFLMTAVNIASGAVYSRGFLAPQKIQIFGVSAVFLALLYNSPAALVLYWTLNNIFVLAKNILKQAKYKRRILYVTLCAAAAALDIYIIFFRGGYIVKRIVACTAVSLLFFMPLFSMLAAYISRKIRLRVSCESALCRAYTFILAVFTMFLLAGLVIPASLIASSVSEFSFIDGDNSPFVYIHRTLLESAGIFIFWPCCIYFIFQNKAKMLLTACASILCAASLSNVFIFPGDYGFLTNTMLLSNPGSYRSNFDLIITNIIFLALMIMLVLFLLTTRRGIIFFAAQSILCMSCLALGLIDGVKIKNEFSSLSRQNTKQTLSPVYNLSKTGKNIVVIMLDRAIGAFVPYVFDENPNTASAWSGFTWYPNCVSFGPFTIYGIPALTGGYEYTAAKMQDNPDKPLVEKHNEAILLLPVILNAKGFVTTMTDPSWSNYAFMPDLGIFEDYPYIHAENITAAYTNYWLTEHPEVQAISVSNILKTKLERFSIFKMAPLVLRVFIYDRGDWLFINTRDIQEERNEITVNALGKYAALDYLPEITKFDSTADTYTIIFNELTHDPFFMQAPMYVPVKTVTDKGGGRFSEDAHYHVYAAAFRLLGEWFDCLKANNVYDNTRIIIVSDHGWNIPVDASTDIILPNGDFATRYNSLLMEKDFDSNGHLETDYSFMTQADVPLLAMDGIVENPVNPFTNNPVKADKENGVTITTSGKFYPTNHGKYRFRINREEWLYVKDNIFDANNWKKAALH
jgi:YidC/Oxa1 family membrane protein insertase